MVMIMLTNKYHPFGGVVLQVFVIFLFVTSLGLREVNCTVDRNCARSLNAWLVATASHALRLSLPVCGSSRGVGRGGSGVIAPLPGSQYGSVTVKVSIKARPSS